MNAGGRLERVRDGESVGGLLRVLRRRWLIALGVVAASLAVMVFMHEHKAKSYSATASVAFQNTTLSEAGLQVTPSSSSEPQREANTQVLIADSTEVAQAAARQLHLRTSASELLEEVKVEAAPSADVLNIQASAADPQAAANLANAFAEQYIAFRSQSQLAGVEAAAHNLQQQIAALPSGSAERTALEQSLQRLSAARAVASGGADIIGRATPPASPAGTSLTSTVVIGLLIGLALAFALVFLLESLDRRVKTVEELEREYRLPALAAIPQSAFRGGRAAGREELLEPYRILRSALDFAAVTRRLDTLLVTSAIAGEGKTTVAVDLAHAVALTGRRTVLVELDLRRPTFAEHFELDATRGLTTALTGRAQPSELLAEPLAGVPNLLVLPAGPVPHNPSELLGSARLAEILAQLAGGESMVIVDAPPLNPVADAHVLLNSEAVDAAIVVARLERVTREEVRRTRAILDRHIVEPVGIVVTGLRDGGRYGYGYGYGSPQKPRPEHDVVGEALSGVGAAPPTGR
ncbi:MAG TPA: polysaccharide biosynthesis tyrosine autokinase [Solirubrobacteraceae bacterium]|nr:polysaccharide biosynthesis tyrosine autokinase [Solirubrobacteraceae bacterium]